VNSNFLLTFSTNIVMQRYYISSARELARLTSVQKSPILNHYGESISGAITIRGFHQEERFMATNLNHLDNFARAYFYKTASREWLIMRMELMSVLAFTVCLLFMVAIPQASINPSTLLNTSIFYFICVLSVTY
jgi:ABC-type multidrug transport system fused ATPase/permease subunit